PLFEEDILRLIPLRAGQPLPPPDVLPDVIEEQKRRIKRYLEEQGYLDGQVEIVVKPRAEKGQVDLNVLLYKGTGYELDETQPLVGFSPDSDKTAISVADIRKTFHHDHWYERLSCLWLCGEYSTERQRRDVERLTERYHEAGFPGARVQILDSRLDHARKRVSFKVLVTTRKRLEVAFRGNHHVRDEDLRAQLTFNQAGSYDSVECGRSAQALHHEYQRQGFYEAAVRWEREEVQARNLVRVTFSIDEGPEMKIRGVDFVGNRTFDAETLREQLKSRPFPAIGIIGLGEGGYLTNTQLQQDE